MIQVFKNFANQLDLSLDLDVNCMFLVPLTRSTFFSIRFVIIGDSPKMCFKHVLSNRLVAYEVFLCH